MWFKALEAASARPVTRIVAKNLEIALFRLEDGWRATSDVCSHEYARLSEGESFDGFVYCPSHGSAFDIRTGRAVNMPATLSIPTYPVKIEDGFVYVELPDGAAP